MSSSRREFLKAGLLIAAAGLAQRSGWSVAAPIRLAAAAPKKVLVLGAGLAGLVAAHELVQAGHDVTILEAQLHPGGRVFTFRAPFSDGLYAEAGAGRIPDNHEVTLRYVRQFNLPLAPFYPDKLSRVLAVGGKRIRTGVGGAVDLAQVPFDLTAEERRLGIGGLIEKYFGAALQELGDLAAPEWPSGAAKVYDSVTMPEFLRQRGVSAGAIELLEWPFATADDDRTSLLWLLRELVYEAGETKRFKIAGGNDLLPRAFAAALKERIRYGCPVMRIEQDARKASAVAVVNGSYRTFEADRLICTIPFPALRKVEVHPAWSPHKRRAIVELGYDPITRVILQSRTRFWEKDGFNGFGMGDLPHEIWHPTWDQPGPRGLLVSFMCSGIGERAGAMDPEERVQLAVRELEKAHPGLSENFEGGVAKVWHADPWVGGGICLPYPGQMTSICIGIERPEGRVHFAGEHTSRYPGWMQGALLSGLRAAREVNEAGQRAEA